MKNIVSTSWLYDHMNDPDLIILDASYPPVGGKKSPYEGTQITGARRFDIDYFSDQQSTLPHMLACADEFQEKAQALGLNQDSKLVIYDNMGVYSAPRGWWMFKTMGHDSVAVLDGGLPEWIKDDYSVEDQTPGDIYPEGNFMAQDLEANVKSFEQIQANLIHQAFLVVDARSAGRFSGQDPEPRPELSSGHMPHAANVPFPEVLNEGKFKTNAELKEIMNGLPSDKPLTFSCGSGLTACIALMAAQEVLENTMSVYDGSWTEWASRGGEIEK